MNGRSLLHHSSPREKCVSDNEFIPRRKSEAPQLKLCTKKTRFTRQGEITTSRPQSRKWPTRL